MPRVASTRAATRWTTRIIPLLLTGAVAYAAYVVTKRICIDYLRPHHETGTLIVFMVLFYFFVTMMSAAYIRTLLKIIFDPGVVPLGPMAAEMPTEMQPRKRRQEPGDLEAQPYIDGPDPDPDSPGLEQFYSKDVFVCENDGRPRWCSTCRTWKPDRAHHSNEIGRCVRKMDHYCPWVGGIISETSFKFFVQFLVYATIVCALVLSESAYTVNRRIKDGSSLDPRLVVALAIAGFFGLFVFTMAATAFRFIFLNLTNVDILRYKMKVHQLAVRVPTGTQPTAEYGTITYPLPHPAPATNGTPGNSRQSLVPVGRDALAIRTFAIVRTDRGENPWDLGLYRNWVSVMGPNVLDWILPIRESPCVYYDSKVSMYEMGPLYRALRARYGLEDVSDGKEGTDSRELMRNGHGN
ncbi:Palmitoyltransferase [Pleurostoma richardsiae]|uniref:Palmitoyltransferase n=1 Tax=Pleurostoma richardsiae TaxID=41990 RepID=A0AA38S339_9PEZI|nr:Palmitoyltransferase [Pleurostoma richardsiae]